MSFELDRGKRLEILHARLNSSRAVTSELLIDIIGQACRRFHAHGYATKVAFDQLVACGAWTDAGGRIRLRGMLRFPSEQFGARCAFI
jgi:hypothetical protein